MGSECETQIDWGLEFWELGFGFWSLRRFSGHGIVGTGTGEMGLCIGICMGLVWSGAGWKILCRDAHWRNARMGVGTFIVLDTIAFGNLESSQDYHRKNKNTVEMHHETPDRSYKTLLKRLNALVRLLSGPAAPF